MRQVIFSDSNLNRTYPPPPTHTMASQNRCPRRLSGGTAFPSFPCRGSWAGAPLVHAEQSTITAPCNGHNNMALSNFLTPGVQRHLPKGSPPLHTTIAQPQSGPL